MELMRERILPTCFIVALFLNLAVYEIGPLAAPQSRSTPPRTTAKTPPSSPTARLAKYEPIRGAYLGAALDLSTIHGPGSRTGKIADAMGAWEGKSWKENAIYVQFVPFPHSDGSFPAWDSDPKGWATVSEFCSAATALEAAPLITLEPQQPRVLVDGWQPGSKAYDATLSLATKMGQWNKPAFLRFAHEMNGSWYPWAEWRDKNKNMQRDPGEETGFAPADYRQAYRNVAAIFRKYAPNVALVWCPNSGLLGGQRRDPFAPFYPGDDVVDWVGLDVYERGWTLPMPGSHLWGGMFAYNLTRDTADDPSTPDKNESVNFYETYAVGKNKPLMLCETGATLSYRTDLNHDDRAELNYQWKTGHWNNAEYGWLQAVYGTSYFKDHFLLQPIDKAFPKLKGIIWFQIGKREYIPAQKSTPTGKQIVWFENEWADYRIGGGISDGESTSTYSDEELKLFRRLTTNSYFLSKITK